MKKELLAGLSAFALIVGASNIALADDGVDNNDDGQAVGVGENNDINDVSIGNGGAGNDAVAISQLSSVNANALGGRDAEDFDSQLADEIDIDDDAFRNQAVNNNNFSSAVNSNNQQAISIAGTNTIN